MKKDVFIRYVFQEKRKTFLLMRLLVLMLLLPIFGFANTVYSQQHFSITLQDATLEQVLKNIQDVSSYYLLYKPEDVKDIKGIDIQVQEGTIEEILETSLSNTNLRYRIENEIIFISRNPEKTEQAQQENKVTVTGKVIDNTREGLPGVTVTLKNVPGVGTVTGLDGTYSFTFTPIENTVLVFTYIGMQTIEIPYAGQVIVNATMVEDVASLDEVVITGMFERKAESFTGSYASFSGEELIRKNPQNVLQALKTLDPSFRITPDNRFGSDPNKLPDINIRGKSSISNIESEFGDDPNQPLFILDGFPTDLQTVVDLSPERVASLTILKDAASTAIYGSQAANGVVVIETIKPRPGQVLLYYSGKAIIQAPDLSEYNMMNAAEKLRFEEIYEYYDRSKYYNNTSTEEQARWYALYNKRLYNVQRGVDTYWLSEPVRTGLQHRHDIQASGGNEAMYYSVGFNYNGQQGVMKKSNRDVYGGNIKLFYRQGKFNINNNFTLDYTEANNPPQAFSVYVQAPPYYEKALNPQHPRYLDIYQIGTVNPTTVVNPLYNETLKHLNGTKSTSFRNNLQVEFRPIQELLISAKGSIKKAYSKSETFKSPYHTDFDNTIRTERGSYSKTTSEEFLYTGDLSVTYGKIFAEQHLINVFGRVDFSSSKRIRDGYMAIGFPSDRVMNPAFSNSYPETGKPSYGEGVSRSLNMILMVNYLFRERYAFDFTYRRDGSSNFGSNNLYTSTFSTGVSWNIHKEDFIGDWADNFKLRFTYGNPGNNRVAYDTYLSYTYNTNLQNLFGLGARVNNYGNTGLEWQKTDDFNVGLDLVIFQRRLSLTFDMYHKVTDPLIISVDIAPSTARPNFIANLGRNTINGQTIKINARLLHLEQHDLSWDMMFHGYHEKAKYSKIGESLETFNEQLKESSALARYRDGASHTDIWTVRSAGIDPMTGREIFIKNDEMDTYTFEYNSEDEVVCGNSQPTLEGVIGTNVYWKGFSFGAHIRYSFGGDYFNNELYQRIEKITGNVDRTNLDKRALYDRWQKPGDRAQYRAIRSVAQGGFPMSSRYIQKNNFFTGESFDVGYTFRGQPWLKKLHLSNLRMSATMNEIFYWSTKRAERGINYPFSRNITFSLNVTF